MMKEDRWARAERHVHEAEKRVARQRALIEELDLDNLPHAAWAA